MVIDTHSNVSVKFLTTADADTSRYAFGGGEFRAKFIAERTKASKQLERKSADHLERITT